MVAQVGAQEVVVVAAVASGKPIIRSITPMSVGMGMRASLERELEGSPAPE